MAKEKETLGSKMMSGIKSAGAQIKADFQHATNKDFGTAESRAAYDARTAAARDRLTNDPFHSQSNKSEGAADQRIKDAMNAGIGNAASATADADMYAENLKRYNEYMESQKQPAPTEITPEMRQAALGMFESQQGAGQMPYYMAAGLDPQATNMSPAFQYAAQNYGTLGGSQRLAPRPMEMMSVAERNRINDMSQAMADQAAQQQMAQNEYQQGMNAMTSGKGNAATMPQQGVPPTQPPMPQYGGGLAAILAKRFGNMGGSGGSGGFSF